MAEMTFDGAFSDLKLKVASETAIQSIFPALARLDSFAHNYTEIDAQPGETVVIPVYNLSSATEFDATTNNYGSATNQVTAAHVTLDKHLIAGVSITDRELGDTGIAWMKNSTEALAKTMGRSLNGYVFNLFNSTNVPLSAEFAVGTKAQPTIQNLYKIAVDNEIDVGEATVVLNAKNFTNLLGVVDYAYYGGRSAVQAGWVDGLFGFKKVTMSDQLPEGTDGVIAAYGSVGICSRYLEPMAGCYPVSFRIQDPDSGFAMGARAYADLASGVRKYSMEALVGAKVLIPNRIVRLVNPS